MKEALELLARLVACPSPSGEEAAVADLVCALAPGLGLAVERVGNNVIARQPAEPVRVLCVSHLDTVPVGEGWNEDPYAARWTTVPPPF